MDMDGIREFVLALLIIAILAGAGAIALNEFQTEIRNTASVTNESEAMVNGTPENFDYDEVTSISAVRDAAGAPLGSGEYSLLNSGQLNSQINITNTSKPSQTFYLDYVFNDDDYGYNITRSGLEGIDNTMDFADTWGVIAGVVVLITIVIGGFVMFRRT